MLHQRSADDHLRNDEGEPITQSDANEDLTPSARITARIVALGDWRGDTPTRMRALIHEADPDVVEEWKWMGTPVSSHDGIVCTGESYKDHDNLRTSTRAAASRPGPRAANPAPKHPHCRLRT